jgi:outer membrane protein OmpA-like peptidoglycan-associated protein/uncharacterized protein YegP (UPF0339 family)
MVNEDYLACSAYEGQSMHETEGNFASFYHEESQRHFFALLDADGKVLLKSEGYPQPAARENGIQSVIKNRTNRDFYSVKEDEDTYYLSLRAANYREIARSCNVGSEAEAMALTTYATGEQVRGGVQATAAAATKERADDRVDDDYMACKSYAGHSGDSEIVAFTHESGQHYFAWYDGEGNVLMRSEGYPTTAARDNGMASVRKNRDMEERYAIMEKMGRFFVILKAGNHQEIARSCPYDSEEAARAIFPSGRLAKEGAAQSAEFNAKAAAATAAAASFAATTVSEATPEVVVDTVEPVEAVVAEAVVDVEDDYLPCRDYHGHTTTPRDGFRTFTSDKTNKFYFAIVDADGDVTLRSEGHLTAADRDEDMADVVKNMFKKERYNIKKVGFHHHFIVLRNAEGKEIARSCAHDSMESVHTVAPFLNSEKPAAKVEVAAPLAAIIATATVSNVASEPAASIVETVTVSETVKEAPLATVVGTVAATVAATSMAAATPVIVETVETVPVAAPPAPVVETVVEAPVVEVPAAPADVEDDYLPCREYEGRPISDKANSVTMFKHTNGQFYFAIYNADGGVRLRSEGFRTSQERDKELSGALKNLNNADMYTTVRRGDYYMSILKDKTGREVGRSCLHKDEPTPVVIPPVVAAAPIAVAAVAAAAAAIPSMKIPEVTVPEVKIPEVKVAPPAYVAPEIAEAVTSESGFKWWWLLLPLLALLAWWMFGKGCNTAAPTAVTVAPPIETKAVEPLPVETPKAVVSAPSCDLNWILFDFDKADITAAAKAELAQMAKILKENKDYVGVLSAHTDGRGTAAYNDDLSLRRAAAAKRTLVAMGIEAGRLKTKADGKGAPVAQNTQDDTGRQFNRRVELYIQDKNGKDVCHSVAPNIPDALKAK